MGESSARRAAEIASVRTAVEMGYRVIDTAEMYGEGGAETMLGSALAAAFRDTAVRRDDLFIVSKLYPHHAGARDVERACEQSLSRLGIDQLDAYLLHWRGSVPLAETVDAFETLRAKGRIASWGVSNFDIDDMIDLAAVDGGVRCAINQIYYSLTARGPAFDLLPLQVAKGIVTMAYSPIDQGALASSRAIRPMAHRLGVTPAQIALAWLQAQSGVLAIPKAADATHLAENLASRSLSLTREDLGQLDEIFPRPKGKTPLAML